MLNHAANQVILSGIEPGQRSVCWVYSVSSCRASLFQPNIKFVLVWWFDWFSGLPSHGDPAEDLGERGGHGATRQEVPSDRL